MASIPLFEGPAGSLPRIAPLDVGIESLELRGREAGARLAQTGEEIQNLRQQRDINDVKLQQAQLDLQQDKELAPLQLEAAKQKLQTENELAPAQRQAAELKLKQDQDAFAQQAQLQDQKQKFISIFQSGDQQAKVNAVTSGEFVNLFGADPKLESAAIESIYPNMTKEQQDAFGARIHDQDLRSFYQKQAYQTNEDYQKSLAGLTSNTTLGNIFRENYPQLSPQQAAAKLEIVPSGSYFIDPANGARTPVENPEKSNYSDIFDNDSKKLLARNIPNDAATVVHQFLNQQELVTRLGIPVQNYSPAARTVTKLQEQRKQQEPAPESFKFQAPTAAAAEQASLFGTAPKPTAPLPTGPAQPAAISNTPDTNQAPVAAKRDALLNSIIGNNPVYQQQSIQKNEEFKARVQQKFAGKEDATFPAAVGQTAALYTNADYRPEQIKSGVVERVNSDPLLLGKPPLVKALAAVESQGRRDAESPTGVKGLLQVTKKTAGQYGLDRDIPEENVLAGERELYRNLKLVRTPELALAAYNAGIGNIMDAIKATGSYDWDVIKDHLKETLHPKKYKEVKDYPERVLNYAAAFAASTPDVEV